MADNSETFDPYRKWLGIPPKHQPPNHYRLLAIELFEADADTIANAADRQMAHVRTFQAGPHSALSQKLLNELSAARLCLLNVEQKAAYDAALRAKLAEAEQAALPAAATENATAAAPSQAPPAPLRPAVPAPAARPAAAPRQPLPMAVPAPQSIAGNRAPPATPRRAAWQMPAIAAIALAALCAAAYLGAHWFGGGQESGEQLASVNRPGAAADVQETIENPSSQTSQVTPAAAEAQDTDSANSSIATAANPDPAKLDTAKPVAPAVPASGAATPAATPTGAGSAAASASVLTPQSPPPAAAANNNAATPPASEMPRPQQPPAAPPPFSGQPPFSGMPFRPPPPPAVPLTPGQIDLLPSIELGRDVVQGDWRKDAEGLLSPPAGLARLRIAAPPGDEYVLVVDVERLSGAGGFGVGLVAGPAHAVLWLGGSGEQAIGLQGLNNDASRGRRGGLESLMRLAYGVRKTGVVLLQPGIGPGTSWSNLVHWDGDFSQWKWPADWSSPTPGRLELISSDAGFRIRRLVLARAEGWKVDDANVARTGIGIPVFAMRNNAPGRSFNEPQQKTPPPAEAELAAARQFALTRNQNRYAAATTFESRLALARSIMNEAKNSQLAAPERYVLFDFARTTAAGTGAAELAFDAVEQLGRWFEIDELTLKLETLEATTEALPTPQGKLEQVQAGLSLLEACARADRLVEANRAYTIAHAAARAIKDSALNKQVSERKRDFDRLAKARAAVKNDFEKLKTAPGDPQANLAVGKYFCLSQNNWEQGLKHLAAGADAALAELARRELSQPPVPEEQYALAEAWWKLSVDEKGPVKASFEGRAKFWYRKAAPFLTGEAKQTADSRLAPPGVVADAANTRFLSEMQELESKAHNNFFFKGRSLGDEAIKVKELESPHGLFMQPGRKSFAGVSYDLDRQSRHFLAKVGIADTAQGQPATPLVFEVWGDGKLLWQSRPIISKGQLQGCDVNVSRVKVLHLQVNCPGANDNSHCVWIEPRVTLK